jgi:hypothetical protein
MATSKAQNTGVNEKQLENGSLHTEKPSNIELERSMVLADLPDPDEGKAPEEKAAIVRL